LVPGLQLLVGQSCHAAADSGVIDEDIDPPVTGRDILCKRLPAGRARNIQTGEMHRLLFERLARLGHVDGVDFSAFGREQFDRGAPNTATATRDNRNPAVQPGTFPFLLVCA